MFLWYLKFSYLLRTPVSLYARSGSTYGFSSTLFIHLPYKYANVRMCHADGISLINVESLLKFRPSFLDVVGLGVRLETSVILFCLTCILNLLLKALRSLM